MRSLKKTAQRRYKEQCNNIPFRYYNKMSFFNLINLQSHHSRWLVYSEKFWHLSIVTLVSNWNEIKSHIADSLRLLMIFIISYNKKWVNFDEIEYNTFKIFMPFLTVFLRSMTRYINKKLMEFYFYFFYINMKLMRATLQLSWFSYIWQRV